MPCRGNEDRDIAITQPRPVDGKEKKKTLVGQRKIQPRGQRHTLVTKRRHDGASIPHNGPVVTEAARGTRPVLPTVEIVYC